MLSSFIGLLVGLTFLIYLTIRGVNLLIAGPLCALIVALSGGLPFSQESQQSISFFSGYMGGFSEFVKSWFLMFLLGSIFGKFIEETGAAESIAKFVLNKIGAQHAALAVVLACAVLTYGGVSVFIVAFAVYPTAVSLFRQANLPRRFIPGALAFGSVTFTMTSAGSPEIQNWIPMKYLGTTPYAGWKVSLVVALFMAIVGYWWLMVMIKKAIKKGEGFEQRSGDTLKVNHKLPHPLLSLVPLLVVIISSSWLHHKFQQNALVIALGLGVFASWLMNIRQMRNSGQLISQGSQGALIAIGNTAAVVGFGAIAKETPAFLHAVEMMTKIPGNELLGAALSVSVIAGLTGSASGGQSIALPLLAPHYMDQGVAPEELHRVVSISSGALDSLPHNGYVVTTVSSICGESYSSAYGAVGALTVIIPTLGTLLAILLFNLGH